MNCGSWAMDLGQSTSDEYLDRLVTCPVHLTLLLWVPIGDLPRTEGFVRLGSDNYIEWRVLACSRSTDPDLNKDEGEIYQRWLAAQPSAVERVSYTTPTKVLRRPSESSEDSASDGVGRTERVTATTEPPTEMDAVVVHLEELDPKPAESSDLVSEGTESNRLKLEEAYLAAATVSEDCGDHDASNVSEHPGNDIEFEVYARELAFLPNLTEAVSTTLDYTAPHVRHPSLSVEQQDRVVKILKSHERIMISSGNALRPPAYGVVCDIDVQGHPMIKQKARRIPLRHLKQRYELLKGLLKAGRQQSKQIIVGDSRLAIQQSLGVIACLKVSLLTQLNIHRELVARFQSVRYLHVTREYNASADSLAGETLVAKEAETTLTEASKGKLEQLNRIHEVIYGESSREVTQISTLRALSEDMTAQHDNFFDFALKPRFITATTRQQAQPAKKRVSFAESPDEDSEASPVEPEPPDHLSDATTEPSHVENGEISPGAAERPPSAEDVDPLEVQEERRCRVGSAQDVELRWANLKLVLKGESSSFGYKAAREAWKMAGRFMLSDDGLLYFLGENRRWGKERMNETILRLVVPTTMVQEVLQSCHDSLE
ncbi:unnamed protein product [Phytophthora fragariaefolia]|uniref:Unnamed protein product n=1 Tax=Phytophthora fragariaefolia TaxID=1490495 RepID=A0A9W7CMW5_9STRA|nr:unnamed protein product [Phytophthora fragariaefolia]